MAIKVADNKERINAEVNNCIEQITENAKDGIAVTELCLPKHISSDIKNALSDALEKDGTNFDFLVIRKGINEFSGRTQYFISETIGDDRYFKIKIYS